MLPTPPAGCPLTRGEWAALQGLAEGHTTGQIVLQQGRNASTVRSQLSSAYRRLGVCRSAQAVAVAKDAGWLDAVDSGWDDHRVSPAQRLYLQAFDRFLLDRSRQAKLKARAAMTHHLQSMCIERDIPVPAPGRSTQTSRLAELPTRLRAPDSLSTNGL
jgi:DNA-binding CsgD family transcriptional regulator